MEDVLDSSAAECVLEKCLCVRHCERKGGHDKCSLVLPALTLCTPLEPVATRDVGGKEPKNAWWLSCAAVEESAFPRPR